jgi:hypothetical protein
MKNLTKKISRKDAKAQRNKSSLCGFAALRETSD